MRLIGDFTARRRINGLGATTQCFGLLARLVRIVVNEGIGRVVSATMVVGYQKTIRFSAISVINSSTVHMPAL